jgi:uncharacterized protein
VAHQRALAQLSRRSLLARGTLLGAAALAAELPGSVACGQTGRARQLRPWGDLLAPDAQGIRLPPGFVSRQLAISGDEIGPRHHPWHYAPDGGATFATKDGGWIYVSNSELSEGGGASALRFDRKGQVVDAYPILQGTRVNCAGGATPWGTWLSCEEHPRGQVFECDPFGRVEAAVRPSLGTFRHEAAAVDPKRGHVYLTEDEPDGCFYRFTPKTGVGTQSSLNAGELSVCQVLEGDRVVWHPLPDPQFESRVPTRLQVPTATLFNGGEGIGFAMDRIHFSTKGDNRVFRYDIPTGRLGCIYHAETSPDPILTGVDNLIAGFGGEVLVAEDGGDLQIVALFANGPIRPLLQVIGQPRSEITGPAFDPSGTRLYFSSQRGFDIRGITYEVSGPFYESARTT